MSHSHSRRLVWAAFLWVELLLGCSRCGHKAPEGSLLAQVPAKAEAVLYFPSPERLGPKLASVGQLRMAGVMAGLVGFRDSEDVFRTLTAQLGFDLRTPEKLNEAGVVLERGLGLVGWAPKGGVAAGFIVLATNDPDRFARVVADLVERRYGGKGSSSPEAPGLTVYRRRPEGSADGPVVMALYQRSGWAFLAEGKDAAEVARWVDPSAPSVATAAAWNESAARLPKDADAYLYLASARVSEWPVGPLTAGFKLERDGLDVHLDLPSGLDPGLRKALTPLPAQDALRVIPDDAFAALRFTGDAEGLVPMLRSLLPPSLLPVLRTASLLEPGATAGFALAPQAPLGAGMPSLSVRTTNPFLFVHAAGAARIKDPQGAVAVLAGLPKTLSTVGAELRREEKNGTTRYLTSYAQGEGLHFALSGNWVVAASPVERLEIALARASEAGGPVPTAWAKGPLHDALTRSTLTLVVDLRRLDKALRGLPTTAWGVGGFAIKAVLYRWLDTFSELQRVSVGFSAQAKAGQAQISIRWSPAP